MGSRFLEDQITIVTGASSGIGRATALALAEAGAHLVLAARSVAALQDVAHQIEALGREALVVPTDVTQRDQVEGLVARTLDRWGRVDLLVANAGQYVRCSATEVEVADLERSLAVNFFGVVYTILAVRSHMLARRRGHIVLMSSLDGKKGMPQDGPYAAAKFALAGFGEVLRQELAPHGICVTTVFPGRVDTPMIESLRVPWVSPKIPAAAVARAVLRGIRRRRAEVIVPAIYGLLLPLNGLLPRLGDGFVRACHIEGWEEEEG